ncbi:MAG TPA: hypothetical protein DEP35_23585 [Deltaproteobacteria bacterium]|nr:hypothetical protein [Deltaproteobacteria bacterium]
MRTQEPMHGAAGTSAPEGQGSPPGAALVLRGAEPASRRAASLAAALSPRTNATRRPPGAPTFAISRNMA